MNPKIAKKIRQVHRRTEREIIEGVEKSLPQIAMQAILAMRKWGFRDRLKFAMWLMVGRGEWKGV